MKERAEALEANDLEVTGAPGQLPGEGGPAETCFDDYHVDGVESFFSRAWSKIGGIRDFPQIRT